MNRTWMYIEDDAIFWSLVKYVYVDECKYANSNSVVEVQLNKDFCGNLTLFYGRKNSRDDRFTKDNTINHSVKSGQTLWECLLSWDTFTKLIYFFTLGFESYLLVC